MLVLFELKAKIILALRWGGGGWPQRKNKNNQEEMPK